MRQTLWLVSVPDCTALYRFLQRLDDQAINRVVGQMSCQMRDTCRKGRRRARAAVDAAALAHGAPSTFFVRRMHHHRQEPLPWLHWLKWVVAVDFVLSQLGGVFRGTIVQICLPSSERLTSKHGPDWRWPTPNSTAREIIPIFAGRSERTMWSRSSVTRRLGA